MSGHLKLEHEPSGPRHYLDGRGVHAGDTFELAVAEGAAVFDWHGRISPTPPDAPRLPCPEPVWLRGRYEWSFTEGAAPRFYLELGDGRALGQGGCVGLASFELPETAVLRWPSSAPWGER